MSIETHALNFSLLKAIGEISERRIKAISELGYDVNQTIAGAMAQFIDRRNGNILAISQNQITYAATSANVEQLLKNPEIAFEAISTVLDKLQFDIDGTAQVKIDRSYPSDSNTFEKAKKLLANQDEILFDGAISVAFRIPFKKDLFSGEFRVEPMFSNPNRYYLDFAAVSNSPVNSENALDIFRHIITSFSSDFEPTAHRAFK